MTIVASPENNTRSGDTTSTAIELGTSVLLERLGLGDFEQSLIATRGGNKIRIWSGTLTNNAGATR